MKKYLLSVAIFISALNAHALTATLSWAKSIVGGTTSCTAITTDVSGNIYVGGKFNDTVDFDPGVGITNLISGGGSDAFIAKYDSLGNFIWVKSVGGLLNDYIYKLGCDASGNVYVGGHFDTTGDFDPGPAVYQLTGHNKFFVLKLNSTGNFLWALSLHDDNANNYHVLCSSIDIDNAGNSYVTGWFNGSIDFDPGTAIFYLNSTGSYGAVYVLKIDANGSFVWAKCNYWESGTGNATLTSNRVKADNSGNVYYSFNLISGTYDLDPGIGVVDVTSGDYLVKLDVNGNYLWNIMAYSSNGFMGIDVSSTGDIYLNVSFDAYGGVGTYQFSRYSSTTFNSFYDLFVAKILPNGYVSWAKQFRNAAIKDESSNSIKCDGGKGVFICGYFGDTLDIDPGPLNNYYYGNASETGFIINLDTSGTLNFGYASKYAGGTSSSFNALTIDNSNHYYAVGEFYGSVDFDPIPTSQYFLNSNANFSGFIARYLEDPCYGVQPAVDSIRHITCSLPTGYINVHGIGGMAPYSYTWLTTPNQYAQSINVNTQGVYYLKLQDAMGCAKTTGYAINSPVIVNGFDLSTNVYNSNIFWSSNSNIYLEGFNLGCTHQNGSLQLVLDTLLTYQIATPLPNQISGDTLTWNFSNLNCDSANYPVSVTFSFSGNIGDTARFTSIITPISGDINPNNNIAHYYRKVLSSYDPNEITVYPQGQCDSGYVLKNTLFTYNIDFQNTGNYPAANIYVLDSLDADLDSSSVRVISHSHPVYTEVLKGNVLKFVFDNINLPDWGTNDSESHGHVTFQIKHKSGINNGSLIKNHADIFFDNNPPVVTNEVFNKVVNTIPCVTDIKDVEKISFNIAPNPANDMIQVLSSQKGIIEIADILGRINLSTSIFIPQSQIDISSLSAGVYVYHFKTENEQTLSGKLVIVK